MPGTNPAAPFPGNPNRDASLWLARLKRGLRESEGLGLREWLKAPANRKAILETARLCHGPDVICILSALLPKSPELAEPRARKKPFNVSLAAGATVCILLCGTILLNGRTPWSTPRRATTKTYATAVGETREIKLADGSTITLNTGTRVGVTYSPGSREVQLAIGEASFKVANQPERPFNVSAGRRQFQALGTRFNLRALARENVELIVTEGQVKVLYAPPRLPDTPARRRDAVTYGEATVGAFEEALVEPGLQSVTHIDESEVEARLAWQRGMLIFDNKALEDVLAEVERYTATRFVLADDKLRSVRVSGRFRAGNVNALRLALRENFLISSRRDGLGRVVLTALPTY